MKVHKARVFEGHKCTTGIHNALLDVVMPELSATTWKILCVLIRQTTGWDREEQGASYATLMTGTGIKSKTTIAACLTELEDYRYSLISITPGRQHEESRYTINRDVEIDWIPQNFAHSSGSKNGLLNSSSSPKNEPKFGSKNEPLNDSSGSENGLSYMKESINLKEIRNKSTERKAARKPDALYEIFAQAFLQANPIPYLSKTADFVQLTSLRKKSLAANWELTEARFALAVDHYFASELGQFTLADLSVRFSAFYKSPLDRFGQPIKNGSNGNGKSYESAGERNSRYIRETLEQCFGASGNDSPSSAVDSEITICLQPTGD